MSTGLYDVGTGRVCPQCRHRGKGHPGIHGWTRKGKLTASTAEGGEERKQGGTSSPPQLVEVQRQNSPEQFKILIDGEDGEIVSGGNGADEEIGIRALNPSASCQVEKTGGLFEIFGGKREVGKGGEMFLQLLELPLRPDTRKDFLTHRPNELNPCLADQLFELFKMRRLGAGGVAA